MKKLSIKTKWIFFIFLIVMFPLYVYSNLTYHTEAMIDSLLQAIDTDHDGSIADETWYGTITSVLGDSSGAVPVLYQTWVAFSAADATPNVSSAQHFETADTTTYTDFDDGGDSSSLQDGRFLDVLCLHAAVFDFTSSGLSSKYGADYTATVGEILVFQYDADNALWRWQNPTAPVATVSSNGLLARTGAGTAEARTITAGSAGMDVADGDGVSGNPTISLDVAPSSGSATLIEEEDALQVKYDSTLTEGANGLGLATSSSGVTTKSTATDYTIGTTDIREAYGGVIYVTGASTITVPAVVAKMSFTVITVGAIAVSVDPNAADRMYLDGVALADGDKATNTSTTGDMLVCTYESADGLYCASGSPDGDHWTDGN